MQGGLFTPALQLVAVLKRRPRIVQVQSAGNFDRSATFLRTCFDKNVVCVHYTLPLPVTLRVLF